MRHCSHKHPTSLSKPHKLKQSNMEDTLQRILTAAPSSAGDAAGATGWSVLSVSSIPFSCCLMLLASLLILILRLLASVKGNQHVLQASLHLGLATLLLGQALCCCVCTPCVCPPATKHHQPQLYGVLRHLW